MPITEAEIHDELVFDVPKAELEEAKVLVEQRMLSALPLSVPLKVNARIASNLLGDRLSLTEPR